MIPRKFEIQPERPNSRVGPSLEACRKNAIEHGWHIVETLAAVGSGLDRMSRKSPELRRILETVRSDFDVHVVYETSRLARVLADQLMVEEEFSDTASKSSLRWATMVTRSRAR
jgi:DNA invertase Pin-like site-specific DNA recombinase